ncbi:MAG: alpha/beta hydrolase [Firmicutes bacterium]|nr:alpha/beta hydrolase [Bacillota bacterium]
MLLLSKLLVKIGIALGIAIGLTVIVLIAALVCGGPAAPKAMDSINLSFQKVDFSELPVLEHYAARDGVALAYRFYQSSLHASTQSVVLIHGSSASSASMHPLAQSLARAGFNVYALDIRGHGDSGTKGTIGYIGQLEDDLEDFVTKVNPALPRTLVGFSSGGGFVLRFAGSERQNIFDRYLLLSPFIHQDAETYKAAGGGWVNVGIPRVVALSVLNQAGIRCFNNLDVNAFAINDAAKNVLTPAYSFALATNFRPLNNYQANILAAKQPMSLIVGQDDELFYADQFGPVFEKAGRPIKITFVPGVGHIGLTLDDAAIHTITKELVNDSKF